MRSRRDKRGPISVPTASMGDIAFLLNIFFILCSNFVKESGIKYQPPKAGDVITVKESSTSVTIDVDSKIYLNGKPIESHAVLKVKLEELLTNKTTPEARSVMFKCDAGVAREEFEPALEAIVNAGGIIVAVGEKIKDSK